MYWLYVGVTVLQVAVLMLARVIAQPSGRGLPLMVALLVALAAGSVIAWGLLLALNAFLLVALLGALPASSGEMLWTHLALMSLTSLALVAVLISRQMRQHVGIGWRHRRALTRA